MINKEYGEYTGVCDDCLQETGVCDTWNEAVNVMSDLGWRNVLNESTGEWENICKKCWKERKDAEWQKRLEQIPRPKLDQNSNTEQTK